MENLSKMSKKLMAIILLGGIFITLEGHINAEKSVEITESNDCLEVIGIALNEKNEVINGVEVRLLKKNEEMEWLEVTSVKHHDHNFKFVLEKNEYYTIEITKPGYVKRAVVISTELPENVSPKPVFSFGFEVTMFVEKAGMDDYYLDFPVALIGYNKKTGVFENSKNYTYHIKAKIKEGENKAMVENMINGKY